MPSTTEQSNTVVNVAPPLTWQQRQQQAVEKAAQGSFSIGMEDQQFSSYVYDNRLQGILSKKEAEELAEVYAHEAENLAKSGAIAPLTIAPDLIGLASQFIEFSTEVGSQYVYGDDRGATNLPDFMTEMSGDPIREAVGLDPYAMTTIIGESAFGNWEGLVAKGGKFGKLVYNAVMSHPEGPAAIYASMIGPRGIIKLAETGDTAPLKTKWDAVRRVENGEDPMTVFKETRYYQDKSDGQWKLLYSNETTTVDTTHMANRLVATANENALTIGQEFPLYYQVKEYVKDPQLFQMYPELGNARLTIWHKYHGVDDSGNPMFSIWRQEKAGKGIKGGYTPSRGGWIKLFAGTGDAGRGTLIHEMDHWIQNFEGFTEGHSAGWLKETAEAWTNAVDTQHAFEFRKAGGVGYNASDAEIAQATTEFLKKHPLPDSALPFKAQAVDRYRAIIKKTTKLPDNMMDQLIEMQLKDLTQKERDALQFLALGDQEALYKYIEGSPDLDGLFEVAFERYKTSGGEVNSNLAQYFADKSKAEVDAILDTLSSPDEMKTLVGVKPDQDVLPGMEEVDATMQRRANAPRDRITDMEVIKMWSFTGEKGETILPVMVDPTGPTEIGRYLGKHVRGAENLRYLKTKNDGLIVWDANEALHDDIARSLGIQGYFQHPDVLAYGEVEAGDPFFLIDFFNDL